MTSAKVIAFLLASALIMAAQQIPAGTALPVWLNTDLNASHLQGGEPISAAIAQDVPLASKAKIRSGAHLTGRVLQAGDNPDGTSYIRIRFDQLHTKTGVLPLIVSLRALASPREVRYAQMPARPPAWGESPYNWSTVHVGGDDGYGVGAPVMHGDEEVGVGVYGGVLSELRPVPSLGCETDSGKQRLALWVFSSVACGVYGFRHLDVTHPGSTDPVGVIILASKKNVHLPVGTGLLLITLENR